MNWKAKYKVRIFRQDIWMEFGIKKYVVQVINKGKRHNWRDWTIQLGKHLKRQQIPKVDIIKQKWMT